VYADVAFLVFRCALLRVDAGGGIRLLPDPVDVLVADFAMSMLRDSVLGVVLPGVAGDSVADSLIGLGIDVFGELTTLFSVVVIRSLVARIFASALALIENGS
jgi:hypothetical protein